MSARIDTEARKIYKRGVATDATTAAQALYLSDWGRIVSLFGLVGDFDLTEDCAQEALAVASRTTAGRSAGFKDSR